MIAIMQMVFYICLECRILYKKGIYIYRNARITSGTEPTDNGTVQFNTMIVHKPKSTR